MTYYHYVSADNWVASEWYEDDGLCLAASRCLVRAVQG